MDEDDLKRLSDRLKSKPVTLRCCEHLAILESALRKLESELWVPAEKSLRKSGHLVKRELLSEPLSWPCDSIPAILEAVRNPSPASVTRICQFFRDVAGLRNIETKARTRPASFKERPAFLVIAWAALYGRRILRSRESSPITEIEVVCARLLFLMALQVHEEIRAEFERADIAKMCPHCALYLDTSLKYCSNRCGDAARSAKRYSSKSRTPRRQDPVAYHQPKLSTHLARLPTKERPIPHISGFGMCLHFMAPNRVGCPQADATRRAVLPV